MNHKSSLRGIFRSLIRLLDAIILLFKAYLHLLITFQWSFSFHDHPNLTASPKEHLRRARKLLKEPNSHLLYSALEIRIALERITHDQIIWAEKASNRDQKEYNSYKHIQTLRRLYEDSKYSYDVFFKIPKSDKLFKYGQYKPLDEAKVKFIYNKLGELLHAQFGLKLGISNDPWYIETRNFLKESIDYLENNVNDNTNFFFHYDDDNSIMVKKNDK